MMYDEFDDRDDRNSQETDRGPEPGESNFSDPAEESRRAYVNDPAEESREAYVSEPAEESQEAYTRDFAENDSEYVPRSETSEEFRQEEPEMSHTGVVHRQPEEESGFYHYTYHRDGQQDFEAAPVAPVTEKKKGAGEKGKSPLWKRFAVCAGMAAVFGIVAGAAFQITGYVGKKIAPQETEMTVGTADTVRSSSENQDSLKTASTESAGTAASTNITQVAKNAMPSIVAITNRGVEEVQSMFFGRTYQQETESAGSGVIISQNDTELLIATNNHVVEGAQELSVCFTVDTEEPEDAVVQAVTKGTDPSHDLAVVAVKLADIPDEIKKQIKVIQIGDSDALEMGQQVVAIGNALGYGQSLTVGYVSALDREVTVDDITNNMIQTDAAINFGNSGGALLNTAGELVGINSVKAASTGVEGMGYAIPMKTAQPILDELMNRVTRTEVDASEMGYLGVVPRDVSDEAKEVYNMPAGAFIYEVSEGSPAEAAGIKKGDIITKLDGQTISSRDELFDRMNYYKAGETIDVVVATAEGGEYVERTVSVTLGERPADADTGTQQSSEGAQPEQQQGDGYDGYENYGDEYYGDDYMNPFEQFFNH